jgi:hypothetical protein
MTYAVCRRDAARTSKVSCHCTTDLNGSRGPFPFVNVPEGKLGRIKIGDFVDRNIRTDTVILANVGALVRLGGVVQERRFSRAG